MSAHAEARAIYLRGRGDVDEAMFAFFHPAGGDSSRCHGVVICPPFGWDEVCSYRARRDWAAQLAAAGHPTLRIDLPGTGDSTGEADDPGRVDVWSTAVANTAQWLRDSGGCERVAAIGIGSGGLIVLRAIADGASIEEAVLWAVPSRGGAFLRELRVFAQFEEPDQDGKENLLPDGYAGAGGFVLSAESTEALQALDVSELELSSSHLRRTLLLGRDGIAVDDVLRTHLESAAVEVSTAEGSGYGAMMAKPHLARSPRSVFESVLEWLEQGAFSEASPRGGEVAPQSRLESIDCVQGIELGSQEQRIKESELVIQRSHGRLFGILAEPLDGPTQDFCAVFLNAGAIRRIGPNRMWVQIARRWAVRGVPTLRLDLEGIGDADGDAERFDTLAELYVPELVEQVRAALDVLEARGLPRRYVLIGLCSGAYWSFHGALCDQRVSAALMLNPRAIFWSPSLETMRGLRRGVLRTSAWWRLRHGEIPLAEVVPLFRYARGTLLEVPRLVVASWRTRRMGANALDLALDRLRDSGKRILFVFSGNEPLHEEFQSEGRLDHADRWPNVDFSFIPGTDHTLRPIRSQHAAREALDRALEQLLSGDDLAD
ncbi:MAG TPA: alpha/beta fold hydrolase [Solirubrobacteraceae bacterium]|jgi:pimeloyl-ACP methyl ester carboxylesterase